MLSKSNAWREPDLLVDDTVEVLERKGIDVGVG